MATFPESGASLFGSAVLAAQTAGFLFLILGAVYAKRKNFIKHDKTAMLSVLLASVSFVWMGFSLVSNFLHHISITSKGLLIALHAITGLLALFMGIFLVLNEIKKTNASMKVAFFSWSAAMFLGAALYTVIY